MRVGRPACRFAHAGYTAHTAGTRAG
ncbi:MAG: hypothetical protein QOD89_31, partial [Bradyrhizobium sp.]|nr:hypothetical protein [Bradyrhizobium sp.]